MNSISLNQINRFVYLQISDRYPTPLTPPGWTFSIWGLIFTSQAVMLTMLAHSPESNVQVCTTVFFQHQHVPPKKRVKYWVETSFVPIPTNIQDKAAHPIVIRASVNFVDI
jgi:hypothetical protein